MCGNTKSSWAHPGKPPTPGSGCLPRSCTPTASPRRRCSCAATRTSTSRSSTRSRCTRRSEASAWKPSWLSIRVSTTASTSRVTGATGWNDTWRGTTSTSNRKGAACCAPTSFDAFQAGVGPVAPTHLRERFPLDPHHVRGEVETTLEQARPHAVHVDRHLLLFELPDLFDGEPARNDDPHVLKPLPIERLAHVPDEPRVDPRRLEGAHLRNHRLVHQGLRRVDPYAIEPLAQRARHLERRPDAVVLEVDEGDETHAAVHELGELFRGEHGVAAVGGDERVRHRADAFGAPPRSLRVGRHADRAGDVRRVPVPGLYQPVVVPGWEKHHLLGLGRFHHTAGVGPDLGAAGEDTQVQSLEVGESVVRALDEQHRLPRRDLVAVVQRRDFELRPLHAAELENRDRLIDAAEEGVRLAEHLHRDAWTLVVLEQQLTRADEVLIRVVALPHLLDGEVEDGRVEPRL